MVGAAGKEAFLEEINKAKAAWDILLLNYSYSFPVDCFYS
jgi:hypothetical protein